MRGSSPDDVAQRLRGQSLLQGLQGPTIGQVFSHPGAGGTSGQPYYSATLVVQRKNIYEVVKQIRAVGGSGVLVRARRLQPRGAASAAGCVSSPAQTRAAEAVCPSCVPRCRP